MKKMKNALGYIFVLMSSISLAQGTLEEERFQLNGGVGASGWGTPVYLGLDYGIDKNITIGGEISYRSFSNTYYDYKYNYTLIGVHFNGNYHFNELLDIPKKFDLYAGGTLGYYNWNNSYEYKGTNTHIIHQNYSPNYSGSSGLGFGLQAGGRYFFNDKLAINLETGGGSVFGAKIGLTLKLGGGSKKSHSSRNNIKQNDSSTNTKVEIKSSNTSRNTNEIKTVEPKKEIVKTSPVKTTSKRKTTVTKKKVTKTKK